MTTADFVAGTILKATGEVSVATNGDSEWEKVKGIGNFYISQYASEQGVDWNSLYTAEYSLGAVTATAVYNLPTTVTKVSDKVEDTVRIDHADGTGYTEYHIVNANELKRYYLGNKQTALGEVCAQVGRTIVFNKTFTAADPQFGGTIKIPVYIAPTLLVDPTDVVPVDNPNWLVIVSAAEYVRNDITLQSQYPNLIAEANQTMTEMKMNNDNAQVMDIVRSPVGGGATW